MRILSIDPGPTKSAYVVLNTFDQFIDESGKLPNADLLAKLLGGFLVWDAAVIEQIASFGMSVGAEVFETVFWSGRFAQAMDGRMSAWHRIGRGPVKMHLCGSMRAKDGNIRQALIDRYGGKDAAIGKKKSPGPLYGISGDCWAALAVAVTWADQNAAKSA